MYVIGTWHVIIQAVALQDWIILNSPQKKLNIILFPHLWSCCSILCLMIFLWLLDQSKSKQTTSFWRLSRLVRVLWVGGIWLKRRSKWQSKIVCNIYDFFSWIHCTKILEHRSAWRLPFGNCSFRKSKPRTILKDITNL